MIRFPRFASVLASAVAVVAARGDPPDGWEPARTTSPRTVEETKALQASLREVAARATPCTVAVTHPAGMGSGVIVGEDGLVLSVAHVTRQPGRSVKLVLPDGTAVRGKTLGLNPKTDTAMVRITDPPPEGATWAGAADGKWPALPLADAADLRSGQWLVSLGHPGGLRKDRPPPPRLGRFDTHLKTEPVFRTDCAITGGDPGGPVLDLHGRVVGIHTRIGLLISISLHVPSEVFRDEWERLLAGEVIGKTAQADPGLELDAAAKEPTVKAIAAGGPAEKAGLQTGDVLTAFDGEPVATAADVRLLVHGLDPDQVVPVVVRRGTKVETVQLKLGAKKGKGG